MNLDARLARIENTLSRALHERPPRMIKRMKEKDACKLFEVSAGRLKQLRLGYSKNGKYYPPQLFNWGHVRGKRIDYDFEELEKHFRRKIAGTLQIVKPY